MYKKILLSFALLVTLNTSLQAISEEEQQAINAFLENAPEDVKASLAPELSEKLLGYQNADAPKIRDLSDAEKEFLTSNSDKIGTLPLTHVNLKNLGLDQVPAELFSVPGIKVINLDWNYLTTLPADIKNANNSLEVLSLNNNKLTKFPTQLLTHRLATRTILAEGNPLERMTANDISSVKLAAAFQDTIRYLNNPYNTHNKNWGKRVEVVSRPNLRKAAKPQEFLHATPKPQNFVKIDNHIVDTGGLARAGLIDGGDEIVETGTRIPEYKKVIAKFEHNQKHVHFKSARGPVVAVRNQPKIKLIKSADGSTTLFVTTAARKAAPAHIDNNDDNDDGDAIN